MSRHNLPPRNLSCNLKFYVHTLLRHLRVDKEIPNSQITLSNDKHILIGTHVNYKQFHSKPISDLLNNYTHSSLPNVSPPPILVLINGPGHISNASSYSSANLNELYVNHNFSMIVSFLKVFPHFKCSNMLLKSHPFLGINHPVENDLSIKLNSFGISSKSIFSADCPPYLASLPAEAILSSADFSGVLSLDISSTTWNVSHYRELPVYLPYNAIVKFQNLYGPSSISFLYDIQPQINHILSNNVIFF